MCTLGERALKARLELGETFAGFNFVGDANGGNGVRGYLIAYAHWVTLNNSTPSIVISTG